MSGKVNPIPEGFHTVTPYLVLRVAGRAIEFYKRAFEATETFRAMHADGTIMHAEIKIGDSQVMLTDESPKFPQLRSPRTLGGSPISIFLYVPDVDALANQAVAAGAKMTWPMEGAGDGDRRCGLEDPFGVTWWVASRIKDITREELQKQYDVMMKRQGEAK
jgi:PhnB protein